MRRRRPSRAIRAKVQAFYNARRSSLRNGNVMPNAAHRALADLERKFSGEFLLVTQNIDDLHDRAPASRNYSSTCTARLFKARCAACGEGA